MYECDKDAFAMLAWQLRSPIHLGEGDKSWISIPGFLLSARKIRLQELVNDPQGVTRGDTIPGAVVVGIKLSTLLPQARPRKMSQ